MDFRPYTPAVLAIPAPNEPLSDYVRRYMSETIYDNYLASIIGCLSSKNAYPITLDQAVEWLAKRKENLKRIIVDRLKISAHYQTSIREDYNPLGGRPMEEIDLSLGGFKVLCIRCKGPRADAIHEYFLRAEELVVQYTLTQLRWEREELLKLNAESAKTDMEKHRMDVQARIEIERYRADVQARTEVQKHAAKCDAGNALYFQNLNHEKEMARLRSEAEMRVLQREQEMLERFGYPMAHLTVARWWDEYVTPCEDRDLKLDEAIHHYQRHSGWEMPRKNFKAELSAIGVRVSTIFRGTLLCPGIRKFRFKELSERDAASSVSCDEQI